MLGSFELKELKCFRIVEPPNSIFPGCTGMEVDTPSRVYRMTAVSEYELREWAWAVEGSLNYLRQKVADGGVGYASMYTGFLFTPGPPCRSSLTFRCGRTVPHVSHVSLFCFVFWRGGITVQSITQRLAIEKRRQSAQLEEALVSAYRKSAAVLQGERRQVPGHGDADAVLGRSLGTLHNPVINVPMRPY